MEHGGHPFFESGVIAISDINSDYFNKKIKIKVLKNLLIIIILLFWGCLKDPFPRSSFLPFPFRIDGCQIFWGKR